MPKPKIDRVKLSQMLRSGKRPKEIAQFFSVSEAAISKARKELNLAVVKNVALESAHRVVDKHLNTIDQLRKINEYANEILDLLMLWSRGDEDALRVLQGQGQAKRDPRELALKAMQEIREQLGLQLDIFKTLYDAQAVAEFQKEVLTAIGEVAPDVRDKIIQKLKENRALRQSVSID